MTTPAPVASMKLPEAALRTVAYSDVFDYPLTLPELHRYLEGVPATTAEVERAVSAMVPEMLESNGELVCLAGRESIVAVRHRRERVAESLWPEAIRCGRSIAALPFVRMVAVTGALAVGNVDDGADLDFLIVTEPGRVWLARWLVVQLVRLHRLRGVVVCPNWVLAADALELDRRDLFAARNLTQMVPIAGLELYRDMRRCNGWSRAVLPNADGPPRHVASEQNGRSWLRPLGERVLGAGLGTRLERLERQRKVREIRALGPDNPEVVLDHRQCKGHVNAHGRQVVEAYTQRLRALGLAG